MTAGVTASAASNDVVDKDPDTVGIKTYRVLFVGRSTVCSMCCHTTTDDLATRVDKLASKKLSVLPIFVLARTSTHESNTKHGRV